MVSRTNRLQALGVETGGGWNENRPTPTQNWITGDRLEAIIEREAEIEPIAQQFPYCQDRKPWSPDRPTRGRLIFRAYRG
jgi:hypothetical protein